MLSQWMTAGSVAYGMTTTHCKNLWSYKLPEKLSHKQYTLTSWSTMRCDMFLTWQRSHEYMLDRRCFFHQSVIWPATGKQKMEIASFSLELLLSSSILLWIPSSQVAEALFFIFPLWISLCNHVLHIIVTGYACTMPSHLRVRWKPL